MNAGPRVAAGVSTRVGAYAPQNELLGVGRTLEDIRVVAIETPLQFNYSDATGWQRYRIIVPVRTSG